jgi:hypothetical protein
MSYSKEQRAAKAEASTSESVIETANVRAINRRGPTPEERAAAIRRERTSFGVQKYFDGVPEKEGWKRRWVNDENVPHRLEQGWTFVSKAHLKDTSSIGFESVDVADRVTKPNKASNPDGSAGMTMLMEIPTSVANEINKAMVVDPTDRIDAALRAGKIGDGGVQNPNNYIPKDAPIKFT